MRRVVSMWQVCILCILCLLIFWFSAVIYHTLREENLDTQWRGEASEASIELVFQVSQIGNILLPALANGVDVGPCVLDSGAEPKAIMIGPTDARRAGLKRNLWAPWTIIRGAYGGATGLVPYKTAAEFQVGPVVIRHPRIIVGTANFGTIAEGSKTPVESLCGTAILHAGTVDIEWQTRRITFYKPGAVPTGTTPLRWVQLEMIRGTPHMRVRVNDAFEGLFLIDTGSNGFVRFHKHAVEEMGLLALPGPVLTGKGMGGTGAERIAMISSLQIGRYKANQIVGTLDQEGRFAVNKGVAGSIGTGLLRHFRVILDLPNKRAAFVAYESSAE
jgi:hypothetical protein